MFLDTIAWVATFLSFIGIILNAKKKISCWYIWCAANLVWILYSILTNQIQQIILWIVFTGFNIYGLFQWKKN